MKLNHILFAIYVIVFPFYFFERGNPQIADIFGVIIIMLNIKDIFLQIRSSNFTKLLFLFISYTLIVNAVWMAIIGEIKLIKSSFYYVYSFFMMLSFYVNIKDKKFLNTLVYALSISLMIQLLLWPFIKNQGVRTMMFFKNPNQLSFWAFSMLIISYMVQRLSSTKTYFLYLTLLLSTFFVFISASKSGIAASVIFWIFFLIKTRKQVIVFAGISVIGVSFLLATNKIDFSNINFVNNVIDRVSEKKVSGIEDLNDRGYDRITNFPQYLFVGAGEGKYDRFNYRIELHSTLFNIFFSYGTVGLLLFGFALYEIIKKSPTSSKVLLGVLILYTLAHMTLRSPLFWISLLLIYNLKEVTNSNTTLENE